MQAQLGPEELAQQGRAGAFQPDLVEACLQGQAVGAQRGPAVAVQRALAETLTHGTAPTPTARVGQGSALLDRRNT